MFEKIQLKRLEIQLKQEEKSADQDVCPLRHAHIAQEMGKLSFGNIFPAAFKTEGFLFVFLCDFIFVCDQVWF